MRALALPLRRPVGTGAVYLLLLLLGLAAMRDLPLSLAPEVEEPALVVQSIWPDASPRLVESELTARLESLVQSLPHVTEVSSLSARGTAEVEVRFEPGTRMDRMEVLLRDRLAALRPDLPEDVLAPEVTPLVPDELDQGTFLVIRATAPRTPAALQTELEAKVLPLLLAVPGVSGGAVYGGPRSEIRVDLAPDAVAAGRVDAPRAGSALREVGGRVQLGAERREGYRLPVVWERPDVGPVAVAGQVVGRAGERPVQLRDVSDVTSGWEDPRRIARVDGEPAVQVVLEREQGTNVIAVARAVRAALERCESSLSGEFDLEILYDQSETIGRELRTLFRRALFSILSILGVLFVALRSLRAGFVVVLTLIFAALVTFLLFRTFGIGLDLVTLAGITLAFGMAVDNSIVVFENAVARGARGASLVRVLAATREVLFPLLAATGTTAIVLLPFLYLSGDLRRFYLPFALSVGLSLVASLVVALSLTPLLARWALRATPSSVNPSESPVEPASMVAGARVGPNLQGTRAAEGLRSVSRALGRIGSALPSLYLRSLGPGLRHPLLYAVPALLLFAGSIWVFREWIDRGAYFPPGGDTGLRVGLVLPRGAPTARTDELLRTFETLVLEHPLRAQGFVEHVEVSAMDNYGSVNVRLRSAVVGSAIPQVLKDELTQRAATLSGVDVSVSGYGPGFSSGTSQVSPSYQLRLRGPDFLRLEQLAEDVGSRLARHPRVRDIDTNSSSWQASNESELYVVPDRDVMDRFGITQQDLASALGPVLAGDLSRTELRDEKGEILARVRWSDGVPLEPQDLRRVFLPSPSGARVPLADLVRIEERPVQREIRRRDQRYERNVSFDFRGPRRVGNRYVESFLEGTRLPAGYTLEDGLGFSLSRKDEREVVWALLLAMVLVYLVSAALFESLVLPFVALLSVPLSFTGIVLLFWATGDPFDRTAYIGLVLLAGIAINSALLLVHRAGRLHRRGLAPAEAARRAARERLLPILLTTATSVAGLVPLTVAAEAGAGDSWRSLALSASAGLIASAVVTLWVVPVLFTLFVRVRSAVRRPPHLSTPLVLREEPGH
ncbi:MAG: efflux RND transporter permease subunit [Candidatus Eisenbacteria bacterium]